MVCIRLLLHFSYSLVLLFLESIRFLKCNRNSDSAIHFELKKYAFSYCISFASFCQYVSSLFISQCHIFIIHKVYIYKNVLPQHLPFYRIRQVPCFQCTEQKQVGWKYRDRPFTGKSDHLCRMYCIATVHKKRPLCHGLMVLRSLLSLIHFFGNACD